MFLNKYNLNRLWAYAPEESRQDFGQGNRNIKTSIKQKGQGSIKKDQEKLSRKRREKDPLRRI